MSCTITFTVWPTRRQLEAKITKNDLSEFDRMYKAAHREAAAIASAYDCEAYVTVCGATQRCRFHTCEYLNQKSILREIMSEGLHRAYWNFVTASWLPLPLDDEADKGYIIAKRLLPPPKRTL